jgi:glutaredoxin
METRLAYETVPGSDTGKEIVMYGLSFCDHCQAGKQFLEGSGVGFSYGFLDDSPPPIRAVAIARFTRAYGKKPIYPILEIDGELIFGFDPDVWRRSLGL